MKKISKFGAIYYDIDGVFRDLISYYYKKVPNASQVKKYEDPNFISFWEENIKNTELCREFYLGAPTIPGSVEKFREIRLLYPEIPFYFITANLQNKNTMFFTKEFLILNKILDREKIEDHLIFVDNAEEKVKILNESKGILIDDRIYTIIKISKPSLGIWVSAYEEDEIIYDIYKENPFINITKINSLKDLDTNIIKNFFYGSTNIYGE